jgi:hypothetical protein
VVAATLGRGIVMEPIAPAVTNAETSIVFINMIELSLKKRSEMAAPA